MFKASLVLVAAVVSVGCSSAGGTPPVVPTVEAEIRRAPAAVSAFPPPEELSFEPRGYALKTWYTGEMDPSDELRISAGESTCTCAPGDPLCGCL